MGARFALTRLWYGAATMRSIQRPQTPKASNVSKASKPRSATPSTAAKASAASSAPASGSARSVDALEPGKQKTPGQVMTEFYDAFVNKRFNDVEKLYAPNVKFKDLVFQYDDRAGTMKMWRKLIGAPGGKYTFKLDKVEGDTAHGRWVADYKLLGRPVHNELSTRMVVRDGKIVEHQDTADWNKWVKQALPLGPLGTTKTGRKVVTHLLRKFVELG